MPVEDRQTFSILSYANGTLLQRDDTVVAEHELALYLNGERFISLLCTPRSLRALVVGFLHAEGIITTAADILELRIDAQGRAAHVRLGNGALSLHTRSRTVTTAGGSGGKTLQADVSGCPAGVDCKALPLSAQALCAMMEKFSRTSDLFLRTGGAHSCALSDGREILLFEDDIGRHNALDKIIGHTLLENIAIDDKAIVTSGRVSSEIVAKVARRGMGIIISRSAPTGRAIELARSVGMTLIGFARGQSLNVYANFSCLAEGA